MTDTGEEWRQDISKTTTATDDTLAFSYRVFTSAPVTSDSNVLAGTTTPVAALSPARPAREVAAGLRQ